MAKRQVVLAAVFLLLSFTASSLFVSRDQLGERFATAEDTSRESEPGITDPQIDTVPEPRIPERAQVPADATVKSPEPTRGPERAGFVVLTDRIDRFVSNFEGGPGSEVSFDVELLGKKFPVALTEFDRVPGSAGSGVFFGYVEGKPHSRVSWAFHGDAEVGEIQVHGQDTLKILPVGVGREHRVQAWEPLELRRCAQCLAEEE